MPVAMIVSVGGTPAPIVKSICEHKPDFVAFLASQDTCDLVAQIRKETAHNNFSVKSELTLVENVNDLLHCHQRAEETVQRVLRKGFKNDEVVVDYTGGTKNMSVAVALATISHGFTFSYVGGEERSKNGIGIVVNGKEEVYRNVNPWDVLAVEERKAIALLFNQYQFKAAKGLADTLLRKTTRQKALFRRIASTIDGYYKWDLFRHREALDSFKRAGIDDMINGEDESIRAFAAVTKKNQGTLGAIVDNGNKPSLLLIHDMYSNAERRFEEGKTDDAILRLYRLVELISQERLLSGYGIETSDVRLEQIPKDLVDVFTRKYQNTRDGKIKIPQAASFTLLSSLGDPVGRIYETNRPRFLDIQMARNGSYLAHGFSHSRDKTYLDLRSFILELHVMKEEEVKAFPKLRL